MHAVISKKYHPFVKYIQCQNNDNKTYYKELVYDYPYLEVNGFTQQNPNC